MFKLVKRAVWERKEETICQLPFPLCAEDTHILTQVQPIPIFTEILQLQELPS